MSDASDTGFGKFVPGFEFLQNLVKGASSNIPQMPNLANWVAPSLNVEELDKRIDELKAVHFWLDQNSKALGATIQALEVQKMTLATLKGMNFNIGDMANAFKLKAADSVASGMQRVTEKAASTAKTLSDAAASVADSSSSEGSEGKSSKPSKPGSGIAGLVDPLQLWSSLTQQFQQIATSAMKDATRNTAIDATKHMASGLVKGAVKATKKAASSAGGARATTKKVTRKAAPRSR